MIPCEASIGVSGVIFCFEGDTEVDNVEICLPVSFRTASCYCSPFEYKNLTTILRFHLYNKHLSLASAESVQRSLLRLLQQKYRPGLPQQFQVSHPVNSPQQHQQAFQPLRQQGSAVLKWNAFLMTKSMTKEWYVPVCCDTKEKMVRACGSLLRCPCRNFVWLTIFLAVLTCKFACPQSLSKMRWPASVSRTNDSAFPGFNTLLNIGFLSSDLAGFCGFVSLTCSAGLFCSY